MKKQNIGAIALTCMIVLGCARQEAPVEDTGAPAAETTATARVEAPIPAATIAPVNVRITLSPAAKARLEKAKEQISVTATYAGDPKESALAQAGPSGMLDLGKNTQLLPGEGTTVFEEDVIDKKRLALIDGEVQLTVNVTSAKSSVPENLLACPFYWDTLAAAGEGPVEIHCSLISENASE